MTEATLIEPRSGPEAEERAYEEAVIEGDEYAQSEAFSDGLPGWAEALLRKLLLLGH